MITSKEKSVKTIRPSKYRDLLILILAGFLIAFAVRYFVIYINIFTPGIAGFSQGATYTLYQLLADSEGIALGMDKVAFENTVYWVIYATLNIPIIFFAYFKYGRVFLMKSLVVFGSQFAATMIFTYVPGLDTISFIPADFLNESKALQYAIYVITALIGAIIYGFAVGLVFQRSASSMGLDPVSRYVSREKNVNLTGFLFTVSFINSFSWIWIGAAISGDITDFSSFLESTIFSLRTLASIVFMGIYAVIVGLMYPTSRKYLVSINTEKGNDLVKYFNEELKYHRGQTITKVIGGYTSKERWKVDIVINAEEFNDIVEYTYLVDENAFISCLHVRKVESKVQTKWIPKTKDDTEAKTKIDQTKQKFAEVKKSLTFWNKDDDNKNEGEK